MAFMASDEKKPEITMVELEKEAKNYAQFSRESIRLMVESSTHHDLPEEAIQLLAEDSNYRLRCILQSARQFALKSFRKKLTTEDFNKALRWSDSPPLYGHSFAEPVSYIEVKANTSSNKSITLNVIEDQEVDLIELAFSKNRHSYSLPSLSSRDTGWFAVEGKAPTNHFSSLTDLNCPFPIKIEPEISLLPDYLMNYYNQMTSALLSNDKELFETAIKDLSTNGKIVPVVSYFVNFVAVGVEKMNHDLVQLKKLLLTVEALINNKLIYIGHEPYMRLILKSVLFCILKPFVSVNASNFDHWRLRDTASYLLAKILGIWCTPVNNHYRDTLIELGNAFNDTTKTFCTHYGAVRALIALGIPAIEEVILPNLCNYMSHWTLELRRLRRPKHLKFDLAKSQCESDAQMVYSLLIVASEFVLRSWMQKKEFGNGGQDDRQVPPDGIENMMEVKPVVGSQVLYNLQNNQVGQSTVSNIGPSSLSLMYNRMYDYFGDALASRLPCFNIDVQCGKKLDKTTELFTVPEVPGAVALLEDLYKQKDEDMRSSECGSRERRSSDDLPEDMSPHSDGIDPCERSLPIDYEVKTQGTLKIKFIRKPLEEPSKKRKIAPLPEPVFKNYRPVQKPINIEFNFSGCHPLTVSKSKRRQLFEQNECFESNIMGQSLRKKLKKIGKIRSGIPLSKSEIFYRKFLSGNLNAIL